jgi:hypothetical protein
LWRGDVISPPFVVSRSPAIIGLRSHEKLIFTEVSPS